MQLLQLCLTSSSVIPSSIQWCCIFHLIATFTKFMCYPEHFVGEQEITLCNNTYPYWQMFQSNLWKMHFSLIRKCNWKLKWNLSIELVYHLFCEGKKNFFKSVASFITITATDLKLLEQCSFIFTPVLIITCNYHI